jgi:hypothetical protein
MPDRPAANPTSPTLAPNEVKELLGAIQSVQQNLQRSVERSHGILTILWGIIMFLIMGFYQTLEYASIGWMHAMSEYAWLGFVSVGLLATSLVGSTFDRAASGPPRLHAFWHTIVFIMIGTIAVIALITTDEYRRIPGFWVLFFPAFIYKPGTEKVQGFAKIISIIAVPIGLFLLIWSPSFGWGVGGLFYLIGLGVLGTKTYRKHRPA